MTERQHAALNEGASDSSGFTIIEKADLESDEGDVSESGEGESGEENEDEAALAGSVVDRYFEADEQHPMESFRGKRAPLQRHDVACKLCLEDIRGERWLCLECSGWSLCSECFHSVGDEVHPRHTFVRARSVDDIYKPVSATGRKEAPVVHLDVLCSSCQTPILGTRYECVANDCQEETSFCEACERLPLTTHDLTHPMIVFKVPCERSAPSLRLSETIWAKQREAAQFARKNRPFNLLYERSTTTGIWEIAEEGPSTKIEKKKEQGRSLREFCMEIRLDKENSWGSTVTPGATFNRSWDVANIGTLPWAKGTAIVRVSPAVFSPILFSQRLISDDVVVVGRTIEIRFVGFQAPEEEGTYTEVWALLTRDGRLFGERLEIQLTVANKEGDQPASDRYYSLKRVLKDVPLALRLVEKEEEIDSACYHMQKYPIRSSILHWDGIEQTFTCTWQLKEDSSKGKSRLSEKHRLKRLHRVGHKKNTLQINDADCVVSLSSKINDRVEIANLKISATSASCLEKLSDDESSTTKADTAVVWFDEVWTLVDQQGVEVGQRFSISHSFLCANVQERGESKKRLLPHMPQEELEEEEEEEMYSAKSIRSSSGKCLTIEVQYH